MSALTRCVFSVLAAFFTVTELTPSKPASLRLRTWPIATNRTSAASAAISSSPSFAVNSAILEYLNKIKQTGLDFKIVVRAREDYEAKQLYKKGADYVLLPQLTSGYYLGKSLSRNSNLQFLNNLRHRDKDIMKQTEEFQK